MNCFLPILIFILSIVPSVSSSRDADVLPRTDDVVFDDPNNLRRRGKKEENQNVRTNVTGADIDNARGEEERLTRKEKETIVQPRIIGGSTVRNDNAYPWFVEMDLGCGGSLISENVVLTAAHCITVTDWDVDVWVGSRRRRDGEYRRVNGVAIHPSYNYYSSNYDFALLTINRPTPNIPPITLNRDNNKPSANDMLTVIGHGESADTLEHVDVPYVPHDACQERWDEEDFPIQYRSMLCAGGVRNRDSCSGDSGGPLLSSDNTQVGITSFGVGCGRAGWPAVYARVSSVTDWIDEFVCVNAVSTDNMPTTCGQRCRTHIIINHDDNPDEISWSLRDANNGNRNILSVPEDRSINEGRRYTRSLNLSPGRYSFRIESSRGDGIDGNGNYMIRTDCQDTNIVRYGNFGRREDVDFEIFEMRSDPTASPTAPPTPVPLGEPPFQLRIDITYDDSAEQTSWALMNRDTGDLARRSKYGSVTSSGLVSFTVDEVRAGNYWLFVLDSEGDGIQRAFSGNGEDAIQICAIVNGRDVLLASHSGTFESLADLEFTLA